MNRRRFLSQSLATGAYVSAPAILSAKSPNSHFQVASIGVAGMGGNTMRSVAKHEKVKIIGLCDVDSDKLAKAALEFTDATKAKDYRELLSKLGDTCDAVTIGTPDHTHAGMAVTALRAKKHVYLQKPLTRSIHEARVLSAEAKAAGVTTQMGTQGHSSVEARLTFELISGGAIGKVKEIICWENKKANWWPKVTQRKAEADPIPATLDWELWQGPAPATPFLDQAYHPSMWRSWCDYGVGMMGDMGCHYFDIVFASVGLTAPRKVRCLDEGSSGDLYATKRKLEFDFPGNGVTTGDTVKLLWSDGGYEPDSRIVKPAALTRDTPSGIFFIGEFGAIFKPHSQRPWLVPEEKFTNFSYPKPGPANHYTDWVDAAMAGKPADTDFVDYGCPVTEAVLLGVLAERNPGDWIEWDAAAGKVTNKPELNSQLQRAYRDGHKVEGLG